MTQPTTLARVSEPAARGGGGAIQQFVPQARGRLNPYSPGGVDRSAARILPLSIISLGTKVPTKDGKSERPRAVQRTDDHWLHLHQPYGPTPGIDGVLAQRGYRSLTVMLPDDDRDVFLTQMWTRFKASSLEAWGDLNGLHAIYKTDKEGRPIAPKHIYLEAASPDPRVRAEFEHQIATCTGETRLFFELAEWRVRDGKPYAVPLYPDGMGYYALRTGSPNSVKIIDGNLDTVQRATNGHLKGIPLELEVIFVPATRPDGVRTEIPCVRLLLKPPFEGGFSGEPVEWRAVLDGSVAQARMLEMPALPARPDPEDLLVEGEVAPSPRDLDVRALQDAQTGDFPCDYKATLRAFMAATDGYTDDQRHDWLASWSAAALGTERAFRSRKGLQSLSHIEALHMLADLHEGLREIAPVSAQQHPKPVVEVVEPGSPEAAAATTAAPVSDDNEDEPDYVEEETEEDLLALANAPVASAPAPVEPPAAPAPPMTQFQAVVAASTSPASDVFPGDPNEVVRGPNTSEGRVFARVVQRARAAGVNVRPFLVDYSKSVTRGDLARLYEALSTILNAQVATAGSESAPQARAPESASDQDLPF